MQVELKGEINGVQIDTVIPIEDVESTSILDFPPTSSSSSGQEVTALKNAVTSLQKDISSIKAQDVVTNTDSGSGTAYNFAVFGLSLGAAGVILAIIAMVRRK